MEARLKILRQGAVESFYNMPLNISWIITNRCNYKCSYCIAEDTLNKNKFASLKNLKKVIDFIADLNRPWYMLNITGGEPTLHPHLLEVLEYLNEKIGDRLQDVMIISNGSRQNHFYDRVHALADSMNINFLISLHTESVEADHIVSLIMNMAPKAELSFNLMFNPALREKTRQIFELLNLLRQHYPFHLAIAYLRGGENFEKLDERYAPEDFAWVDESIQRFLRTSRDSRIFPKSRLRFSLRYMWDYMLDHSHNTSFGYFNERNQLLERGFYNFRDMWCLQGSTSICIDPVGRVLGAQCPAERELFNIYEGSPDDYKGPLVVHCPVDICGCGANDILPKFSSQREGELFGRIFSEKQAEMRLS